LLFNAAPVIADTELEMFANRIQRTYALEPLQVFSKPPKGLCVCINDPSNVRNVGAAGILSVAPFIWPNAGAPPTPPGRVYVTCNVMMAEANGDITQGAACPEWVPLSK
jgi:hypothetical protein